MKLAVNHNGADIALSTNLSLKTLDANFDDVMEKFRSKVKDELYKEATREQTEKIRDFVNSPQFSGLKSLTDFFDSLNPENRVIPTLYAELIFIGDNTIHRKVKFTNVKVGQILEGIKFEYSTIFHPVWLDDLGIGIDSKTSSIFTLFIADSLDKIKQYNKEHNLQ